MKDIKIHNESLISIKSLDNGKWSDKIFFKDLLRNFITDNSKLIIIAKRPNYNYNIEELNENARLIFSESENSQSKNDYFTVILWSQSEAITDNHLEVINSFWLFYEQPTVVISDFLEEDIIKENVSNFINFSWEELTLAIEKSFIFYRGIEDDVLWIGKSSNTVFGKIPSLD